MPRAGGESHPASHHKDALELRGVQLSSRRVIRFRVESDADDVIVEVDSHMKLRYEIHPDQHVVVL